MPLLRLVSQLCQLRPRCPPCARSLSVSPCQRARQSNYYELLGICPDASMKEVKRAFFAKSKELHPDRDPKNPALHNQFVELNEAYRVLSKECSRRAYDNQLSLRGSAPPPGPAPRGARPSYRPPSGSSSWSWAEADARYWGQFRRVRPEDFVGARQRQQKQNHRVLGYCLLLMLGGMVMHYVAFRKLEQVHRSFMDEKDRVIMAIYNESRTRARSLPPGAPAGGLGARTPPTDAEANSARLQQEKLQKAQSPQPRPEK